MLAMFDNQMLNIERQLKKEQEDNDNTLKAKLAKRQRRLKRVGDMANENVAEKQGEIDDKLARIDEIQNEKDALENKGINTKELKKERDIEFKERMEEL